MKRIIVIAALFLISISFTPTLRAAFTSSAKVTLTDFYWWYPWYGAQWKSPPGSGTYQYAVNQNGSLRQDAFTYQVTQPIPFLQSAERPAGDPDTDGTKAKAWFKGNFSRAAANGIDVMAVMVRPDLAKWQTALGLMIDAIKELKQESKPYPKLLMHYDGVEYWEQMSPSNGQLTGPGVDYNVIRQGTYDSFSIIMSKITNATPLSDFLFMENTTIPIFIYRIEASGNPFVTSNWWVTQLKQDFALQYPGYSLYMILDDLWCNHTYGTGNVIQTASCNADNYYHWGGAFDPIVAPQNNHAPIVVTVGPGFDNSPLNAVPRILSRQNGTTLSTRFSQAVGLNAQWILFETFNFGEEGTTIDETVQFGTQYLALAKNLVTSWRGAPTPTLTPIPPTPPSSPTNTPTVTPTGPTPTPTSAIPNAPSWIYQIPSNLRNFLELLYITVYYFNRPSNMDYLLEGVVTITPTP